MGDLQDEVPFTPTGRWLASDLLWEPYLCPSDVTEADTWDLSLDMQDPSGTTEGQEWDTVGCSGVGAETTATSRERLTWTHPDHSFLEDFSNQEAMARRNPENINTEQH